MASRFPALTLALGCAIAASGTAQERADSAVLTQVIDGHTLRQAGVVRIGDLLTLLDGWDPATIDELTWDAQPAGSAPLGDARWLVLVDGQRLELDLFGTTSLNRLPLPLGVIDRVVVTRTPLITGGELATFGVVHIHTVERSRRFQGGAWGTTGSEINDPGPFAFTPLATPNVDRIGNDVSGDLAYGGQGWSVAGGLRFGRHNFTDPAIVTRYGSAAGDLGVKVTLVGGWGRVAVRTPRGRHDLLVLRSRLDDHLPLDPVALELAVREQFTHVGASGTLDAGRGTALRYTATWSVNEADDRGSAAMPFAWRAEAAALGGEVAATAGSLSLTSGARVRRIDVTADRPIADDRLLFGTLYGSAVIGGGRSATPVLRAALTLADGEAGVAAALGSGWRPAPGWMAQGELSYNRPVRAADNSIWGWAHRGDPLLTNTGLSITQDGPLRRLSAVGADVALGRTADARVNVRVAALWRGYGGLTIPRRELAPVPISGTFAGPTEVVTDGSGQILGALGQASARLGRVARVSVAYRLAGSVQGDDAFRAAAATVPVHALRSMVAVTPAPGVDLWGMVTWRSSTTWEDYTGVEAVSAGAYRARVPGWVNLDLAAQKWFWHRRLRLHAGFRNVFGATVRYHPAGAELGSRFLLQGELAYR